MPNNLYNQLNNGNQNNIMQAIKQLKQQFKDPKQAVMSMLSNGQITQAQVNSAMQMAKQFKGIIK